MTATRPSAATRRDAGSARMRSVVARTLLNERVEGGCHRIVAQVDGGWPATGPGQFTMLSLDHPRFPLLPRPFSLLGHEARADGDRLEWMIMPVGTGTALLCSLQPGEPLNVVGPLGRALDADLPDGPIVCVGGGYGIAPFIFLSDHWRRTAPERLARTTIVYGARTAERLSLRERVLRGGAARVELCTDDGTLGRRGRVDAALEALVAERRPALVLTCGPEAMMEAVGRVCREQRIPARASLETVMGCGYAVCNGCAVAVGDGRQPDGYTYELACREGTVFDETRLQWHRA